MPSLLDEFELTSFAHEGTTCDVYRAGSGPAVIVIAEMPGITEKVMSFALRVRDLGCSVWLPRLFGVVPAAINGGQFVRAIVPGCVSKEFAAFATGRTAPVTNWLRALAAHANSESGGPGVGVIGMCFTGGFALGMMVDDVVLAPVLTQPSLPLGLTARHRADLQLSAADLARVKERTTEDGICVLGLRFTGDSLSPAARFETLRRELGDAFIGVEIDSSSGNAWGIRKAAHSVLTEDLTTEPADHPTAQALEQVLDFFREKLIT